MTGLDAFAAEQAVPRANQCRCCRLRAEEPALWQEVLNGRARPQPHSYPTISRYLRSKGQAVTSNQLRDHFVLDHEETR